MAGYFMSGLYFCEHRTDRPAFLHAVFATILEWTAMRNIQRAGGLTFDALDLFVLIHMNGKLCPQKSLCIWMKRLSVTSSPRNYLHDIPEVHDSNLMSKGTDQSQVMADKSMLMFFSFWRRTRTGSRIPVRKRQVQR